MLQNPCKTLGFKKNMVYKIPPGGGGKPYPASGLIVQGNSYQKILQHIRQIFERPCSDLLKYISVNLSFHYYNI